MLNTLEVHQVYGTHTQAFQGMDSSLLQSKFHLGNDSNYVMFYRKIFQWVTKGEDVPSTMGQEVLFSVWNEHILIGNGSRMIWTESLIFLANEVTACLTFLLAVYT